MYPFSCAEVFCPRQHIGSTSRLPTYMHAHMHTHKHALRLAYRNAYICACIHMHMHACTHASMPTYMHKLHTDMLAHRVYIYIYIYIAYTCVHTVPHIFCTHLSQTIARHRRKQCAQGWLSPPATSKPSNISGESC